MGNIPDWLVDVIAFYAKEHLGLMEYRICVYLERCVGDNSYIRAQCSHDEDLNTATLTFRDDIVDEEAWHQTIIHELLHVKHGRIDQYVELGLIPNLPKDARKLGWTTYLHTYESYTNHLAFCICKVLYPLWQDKNPPPPAAPAALGTDDNDER